MDYPLLHDDACYRRRRRILIALAYYDSNKVWLNTFNLIPTPFNIDHYTEDECHFYFRFGKAELVRLQAALRLPPIVVLQNGARMDALEALCICLRRLAYPCRLVDLVNFFGREPSRISRICNFVVAFIYSHWRHLLEFSTERHPPERLRTMANAVHAAGAPLPNCFGFVDGTVRPICRPVQNQQQVYNGHKRYHGLKFQSVVTPDGLLADFCGPWLGRRHDARMLRESGLKERLEELNEGGMYSFYIYGDPAYPVTEVIQAGFRGARLSADEQEFNRLMSGVRITVEWGFNLIIEKFAFLDYTRNQKLYLQPVAAYYIAGALLTNAYTTLYGNSISNKFSLTPPSLEEYLQLEQ